MQVAGNAASMAASVDPGYMIFDVHPELGLQALRPARLTGKPASDLDVSCALLGTWRACGLPLVEVTPQRLVALATEAPFERPRGPWLSWLTVFPRDHNLAILAPSGALEPVRVMHSVYHAERDLWCYVALASSIELAQMGRTAEYLRDGAYDGPSTFGGHVQSRLDETDQRTMRALNLVNLNVSLALNAVTGVERVGPERPAEIRGSLPAGDYVLL
jgi:hypothetical protein